MPLTIRASGSVPVAFPNGTELRNAFAYQEVKGLVIVCLPLGNEPLGDASYSITHRKSGRKVGPFYYASLAEAEAALERIASMLDWTEDMDALQQQLTMRGFVFTDRFIEACRPQGRVAA